MLSFANSSNISFNPITGRVQQNMEDTVASRTHVSGLPSSATSVSTPAVVNASAWGEISRLPAVPSNPNQRNTEYNDSSSHFNASMDLLERPAQYQHNNNPSHDREGGYIPDNQTDGNDTGWSSALSEREKLRQKELERQSHRENTLEMLRKQRLESYEQARLSYREVEQREEEVKRKEEEEKRRREAEERQRKEELKRLREEERRRNEALRAEINLDEQREAHLSYVLDAFTTLYWWNILHCCNQSNGVAKRPAPLLV